MDILEIEKRIEYISLKLKMLRLAIDDYKKQKEEFEIYKVLKTIERDSEEIIESSTRINQEILISFNDIGETYRDSFEKLAKNGVLKKDEFLKKLSNTTGFRNRLAHDYINLDEDITIISAKNILSLYPKYLLKIKEFLSKSN